MPVRAIRVPDFALHLFPAICIAVFAIASSPPAWAEQSKPDQPPAAGETQPQNGDVKKDDAKKDDAKKDAPRKTDELMEVARQITGPAGQPECVWFGRRVVNLLWRDDMDTAFRHFDLYDRFGCPSPHIQAAFRCVVQQGLIDPKMPESLQARINACWIDPTAVPPPPPPPANGTESPEPPSNK